MIRSENCRDNYQSCCRQDAANATAVKIEERRSPSDRPFLQQNVGDDKSANDKEDVDTEKTCVCARELCVVHQHQKNSKRAQCLDIGSKSLLGSFVCRTTWFDRDDFCRMVLHVEHPLDFCLTNHDTKFGFSRYVRIFGFSCHIDVKATGASEKRRF